MRRKKKKAERAVVRSSRPSPQNRAVTRDRVASGTAIVNGLPQNFPTPDSAQCPEFRKSEAGSVLQVPPSRLIPHPEVVGLPQSPSAALEADIREHRKVKVPLLAVLVGAVLMVIDGLNRLRYALKYN